MQNDITKQAFNRKEGAAYIGVAENTFRKLLDSGEINYITLGRRLLIPKISLDNYLSRIAQGNSNSREMQRN